MDKNPRKRINESGSSYRKKKSKREDEANKLKSSMNKFLVSKNTESDPIDTNGSDSDSDMQTGSLSTSLSGSLESMLNVEPQPSSSTTEKNDDSSDVEMDTQCENESKIESEKQIGPNEHDPHTWPATLSSSFREKIIKSGLPPIPSGNVYPVHDGRKFIIVLNSCVSVVDFKTINKPLNCLCCEVNY